MSEIRYGFLNGVPIEPGEGWELVPAGTLETHDMEYFEYEENKWFANIFTKARLIDYYADYCDILAFRRPITKPSQTLSPPMCHHLEVYYSDEHDNYYCQSCHGGMGLAYYKVARERDALKSERQSSIDFSDKWVKDPNSTMPSTREQWSKWMVGWNALKLDTLKQANQIASLSDKHDLMVERSVGAMHVAEGEEGWEIIISDCPMMDAVKKLRMDYATLKAKVLVAEFALRTIEAVSEQEPTVLHIIKNTLARLNRK